MKPAAARRTRAGTDGGLARDLEDAADAMPWPALLAVSAPDTEASLAYLAGHLGLLDVRIRAAVARRRADDPDPDDRFRGLYVSDDQVDRMLAGARPPLIPVPVVEVAHSFRDELERAADVAEEAGRSIRLRRLVRTFGLGSSDLEVLLVALAPDLDPRIERLYGYLHDDVTQRRASVGLALELSDPAGSALALAARGRLNPAAPLIAGGLLVIEDATRPMLSRTLRVPDRVTAFLLGDDTPDPSLRPLLRASVAPPIGDVAPLVRALVTDTTTIHLRERPGASGRSFARQALERAGRPALELDLTRSPVGEDVAALAATAVRDARLGGAVLVVGPVEVLAERDPAGIRAFAEAPCTVVFVGTRTWDPQWAIDVPISLEVAPATTAERHALWVRALQGDPDADVQADTRAPESDPFDPAAMTVAFRLTPDEIEAAAGVARRIAAAEGRTPTGADVRAGARAQNGAGLERLARRIEPAVQWSDLVLPSVVEAQLRELSARLRFRDRVVGEWGLGTKGTRGLGVTALFAGESGTGKTMSAEVVAADLGFDVYVIDLSTVIDKYIGETEKNLDRIFTEADQVSGVLLFDEADALFGKRSEVKDARDRYANVEVAYLLQRMERFDGLAILTTNLRSNLDDAFMRRLDALVDFPMPEEDHRRRLWERHLPPSVPRATDLDLDFLAARFKLSGGNIRNVCVAAAYFAAADGRSVTMADLVRGTEREYRKLGRLTVEAEFGTYLDLLID